MKILKLGDASHPMPAPATQQDVNDAYNLNPRIHRWKRDFVTFGAAKSGKGNHYVEAIRVVAARPDTRALFAAMNEYGEGVYRAVWEAVQDTAPKSKKRRIMAEHRGEDVGAVDPRANWTPETWIKKISDEQPNLTDMQKTTCAQIHWRLYSQGRGGHRAPRDRQPFGFYFNYEKDAYLTGIGHAWFPETEDRLVIAGTIKREYKAPIARIAWIGNTWWFQVIERMVGEDPRSE